MAVDKFGSLIFTDNGNSVVRKLSNGIITTLAGTGSEGYLGDGGPATSATLSNPEGLGVDAAGNIYVADTSHSAMRKLPRDGTIPTTAGTGTCGYNGDNQPASTAELCFPQSVKVDSSGNIYISDGGNGRIRKVTAGGAISTVAGDGQC